MPGVLMRAAPSLGWRGRKARACRGPGGTSLTAASLPFPLHPVPSVATINQSTRLVLVLLLLIFVFGVGGVVGGGLSVVAGSGDGVGITGGHSK